MMKICSFVLVLVCFAIRLFQKSTSRHGEERMGEVLNARSTESCEFNVRSVRKQDKRSVPRKNSNESFENIKIYENESNERGSDFDEKEMNCEIVQDVSLNEAASVVEKEQVGSNAADEKMMIVFDEKARKDGFRVSTPEEAPYAVVLRVLMYTEPLGVCSGSLITARWVITAAHCFNMDYNLVLVYAGGNSVDELDTDRVVAGSAFRYQQEVYTHPMYRPKRKAKYDVALVQVKIDFELTSTVNTVNLSLHFWQHRGAYRDCQVTGFGRVHTAGRDVLDNTRKTHFLEVTDDCECVRAKTLVMCSKPKEDHGICSGDSGGGLICDGELVAVAVGILAFRDIDTCTPLDEHVTHECGARNTLNVFQQVCPYIQWISAHVSSIDLASVDVQCYDPSHPADYDHWGGDDYHSDDYEDGGNFDTVSRTPNLLLLTSSLVLLINRVEVQAAHHVE